MARKTETKGEAKTIKRQRPSTTGKRKPKVDQTNWRKRLQQSRIKFDDEQKETFLDELSRHGLKGRAAKAAGVSLQTINNHLEIDPEFEEAHETALSSYRDILADEVRRRGVDGWLEPVYNKDGRVFDQLLDDRNLPIMRHKETGALVHAEEYMAWSKDDVKMLEPIMVPAFIRKFSDRMLELDVKRVDPTYRDKSTVDLNHAGGGVLVAPEGQDPEDWIKEQEEKNKEREDPRIKAKREQAEARKEQADAKK